MGPRHVDLLLVLKTAFLYKNKKEGGRRGLRPWPLRCLSQFLSERKERLLSMPMNERTFHRWGGHVFIVDIRPVG